MVLIDKRKEKIAKLIKVEGFSFQEIYDLISIPQDSARGDYALPCFKFAKTLRKSPVQIAEMLKEELKEIKDFDNIEAVSGYLNFTLKSEEVIKEIVENVVKDGSDFGNSDIGKDKTVCIDYSSINIAKPFHMGHLSTTAIGAALYRMYKKMGFTPIGINHLGDWGTQFGKLIVAYKKWSNQLDGEVTVHGLNSLYVKFHDEADKDPSLEDEARAWFKKIEDGNDEALKLYNFFKEVTLREVKKVYERLNVKFDSWDGEAFYNDKMGAIIDRLEELNLIELSDGAKVVNLAKYEVDPENSTTPPCLLVKADGATLYATRDLAAAFYRKKTYDFYKSLYVVAYQQNLHFSQVFKVIELMGEPWYKDLEHVAFGMVSLESGALSTRKGNVVLLEDVLNKAVEKSLDIITQKNPNLENKEDVAEKIGVGAVIYSALSTARIKDTVFSYDKVLSFEGETGPYLQYSNARCLSVLRRAKIECTNQEAIKKAFLNLTSKEIEGISDTYSKELVMLIDRLPFVVFEALEKYEPYLLSKYLIDVAKAFNKFYMENRILNAEEIYIRPRLALVYATHIVLEEGLKLLGIGAPQEM
ncbi:MAG: arginine--tRNA ligase [Christensenellales bacterium]|jgi:arginyl-tRNA synthetase|nr:arginine--tRNA ligase [Clostridiales bacterium]